MNAMLCRVPSWEWTAPLIGAPSSKSCDLSKAIRASGQGLVSSQAPRFRMDPQMSTMMDPRVSPVMDPHMSPLMDSQMSSMMDPKSYVICLSQSEPQNREGTDPLTGAISP